MIKLRTILERFSRDKMIKRHLPSRFGGDPIFVSPDAGLRFWRWDLQRADESLFDYACEFVSPGDVVWDVGANVGLFTFASAAVSGESGYVLAIEPDPLLVHLLHKSESHRSTQRAQVDILPVAVSDSVDITKFHIAKRGRCMNFVEGAPHSSQAGGIRETQLVVAVSLDWLLERFPAPQVLKIDVEGAEYQVLKGGQRVLADVQPIILCEVNTPNREAVSGLLHSYGYTLSDLGAHAQERRPLKHAVNNTLASPPS